MTGGYGVHSSTAPLHRVAVRRPPAALAEADPARWHYAGPIDLGRARDEHAALVGLLEDAGADVVFIDDDPHVMPDSVFAYDPSLVTNRGAVLGRMGKELRRPETDLHERFYAGLGVPILGRIRAPGTLEAGDTLWIDPDTLAVGRGYRTNDEGIGQLASLMADVGVEVIAFDLPVHHGPDACLHLMSLVSLCADDLALVHLPLLPVRLLRLLEERGYTVVAAPPDEFEATAGISANVLATGPRRIVAVEGSSRTRAVLESAGCEVATFPGDQLCLRAEGGPTCLTRPLLRSPLPFSS